MRKLTQVVGLRCELCNFENAFWLIPHSCVPYTSLSLSQNQKDKHLSDE